LLRPENKRPAFDRYKMLEKNLQRKVLKRLKRVRHCKAINFFPGTNGERGTPDVLCCCRGQFFVIELKAEGKQPNRLQVQRLREWKNAGAVPLVFTEGDDLEALIRLIELGSSVRSTV